MMQSQQTTPGGQVEKVSVKGWTEEEILYLKEHASHLSVTEMAKTLNRSYRSTYYQLEKRGWLVPRRFLSDKDRDFISKNWRKLSINELCESLNLSRSVIYREARLLGLELTRPLHFWTEEEEAYLVQNWKQKSLAELAKKLNRTPGCVRQKAHNFGLRRRGNEPRRIWTAEDESYLRLHWGKSPISELSEHLRRTPAAIRIKASHLKLERLREASELEPWSAEDEAFLVENWQSQSIDQLMKQFNKSAPAIYAKAYRLKLGAKIDDGYSASEVARILGVYSSKTVIYWIEKGWITGKRSRLFNNHNYCITETQLKNFMRQHPHRWSFENLTYDPFYDSNAKWVREKRQADRQAFLEKACST